ncbi:TrbC/VirB2 family protein [Candidatus Fokinia crypta]|uniref:Type IV secretory pathway, VirB2 component n=1 Tax=Candidatus Fokinia crypta TaxID=1920990 RepID=A0ABZ0UPL0_9RICK|nr:TrbC/VirB2 family protein [Candidatus Fokinia cryptica]WPX98065.1 Type IV secretory pathway, VirB2 component [Candidatus Fokinia cryptica]
MKHIKKLSECLFFIVALLFPTIAIAAGTSSGDVDVGTLDQVLCNIFEVINGPIVTAVITVTIISTGIGGLFGKVSWTTVVVIFIAGAIIVGAPQMADVFTSSNSQSSTLTCTNNLSSSS